MIRFGQLQHCMVVFFVRELTRDLPALRQVKLHGYRVRLNDAEAALLVTTCSYLRFASCEQFSSNAVSSAFPQHPQITNPLLTGHHDPDNLRVVNSHPRQGPIIILELERYRIRSKEVAKRFSRNCLYQRSYGVVLVRLRLPDDYIDRHARSLAERLACRAWS